MRKLMGVQRLRPHRDAISRQVRRHVPPVADLYRVEEVFVEMVDVFQDAILQRSRDVDVVN